MATTSSVPGFVRVANKVTAALLTAGVQLRASQRTPMYLLTVRGRKSGQPRSTPVVVISQDGERYLASPYGVVDWVRNLRAAREATLTRGRHIEQVHARELSNDEAAVALQHILQAGIPSFLLAYFEVKPDAPLEEFQRAAAAHPVFVLQSAG